jgi:tetratricopeptide (TPR) repeat protein
MRPRRFPAFIMISCFAAGISHSQLCQAERGFVLVFVQDSHNRPVRGVEIRIEGIGSSKMTGDDGKAQLPVVPGTKEGDWIPLIIVHSPPGRDLVMFSPWDNRSPVPSFEDKQENFIHVIVVQKGDLAALERGDVLASLAAKINKANAPKSADKSAPPKDPKENLIAVATQYGLGPDEVDEAIRAWGKKATDPYEAGLAALYERDFPMASAQLKVSLKQREESLAADQTKVADAAFFLGSSLYSQGKYRESAQAFEKCLEIRPDDPAALTHTGLSLMESGDYARAELLSRRTIAILDNTLGPDDPDTATGLNNLAWLLKNKGDYAGAEPLYRRAITIKEKALGPDNPKLVSDLSNLAELLRVEDDYTGAELLLRRALKIDEKALGLDDIETA